MKFTIKLSDILFPLVMGLAGFYVITTSWGIDPYSGFMMATFIAYFTIGLILIRIQPRTLLYGPLLIIAPVLLYYIFQDLSFNVTNAFTIALALTASYLGMFLGKPALEKN